MTQMRPIWVRREVSRWDWYDWNAKTRVCSDMTETPNLPLTLIWLRRLDPNSHRYDWDAPIFLSLFLIVLQSQVWRIEKREQIFFGRLSHICARLGQGVSVILVSTVSLASQSYHCKLWFKRLTHISLSSTPRVSLISVSVGLVWRSHIRHPPIFYRNKLVPSLWNDASHATGSKSTHSSWNWVQFSKGFDFSNFLFCSILERPSHLSIFNIIQDQRSIVFYFRVWE